MRALWRLVAGCSLVVPLFAACSSKPPGTFGNGSGGSGSSGGSGDDGSALLNGLGDDGSAPVLVISNDASSGNAAASLCKGGHYSGTFDGSYESSFAIGIPLKVSGNVDMTLNAYGSPTQTCSFMGETESCSNLFKLSGGTITGVANQIGDSGLGGFPYFCFMSGTLDCAKKKLVGGWIECVYCVIGVLDDGGMKCDPSVAGIGTGQYGNFAGPLTADYNTTTFSFVNGTWNGAEALAHNNGTMPGPEGGPVSNYLIPDGGYGFNAYGGAGTWNATHQ